VQETANLLRTTNQRIYMVIKRLHLGYYYSWKRITRKHRARKPGRLKLQMAAPTLNWKRHKQ